MALAILAYLASQTFTLGTWTRQPPDIVTDMGILVNVSVNLSDAGNANPFVHKWKRSFGSGHAALTLRDDWRQHLFRAVTEIGLAGVRYHGLFDDDMGPVVTIDAQGSFVYNWCVQDGGEDGFDECIL